MHRLAGESIIPAQTSLYHCSKYLTQLLSSGKFDPKKSKHDGAMFFTMDPTPRTNIAASSSDGLRVFDNKLLTLEEAALLEESGDGNLWPGASTLGFDGRLYLNPDPYAEVSPGNFTVELVIFERSLEKLTTVKAFET